MRNPACAGGQLIRRHAYQRCNIAGGRSGGACRAFAHGPVDGVWHRLPRAAPRNGRFPIRWQTPVLRTMSP
ncbi:hypothetical protein EMIT0158MI4_170004 [Burkholderia ambifaria]